MTQFGLAFDRSARFYDEDKRLHVSVTNISKANVCPYNGSEIPNYQALGLHPNRVYQLFRDPEELAKAAPTFNRLPVLSKHVHVSAEDHQPDLVVGSTGSEAAFNAPYLQNSLVVWKDAAIAGIETEAQKELSSAYRYDADMTPGEYQGVKYDGVMRNIRGNHVALVETGRAGSDVVVGDSALKILAHDINEELEMSVKATSSAKQTPLSRQALLATGAIRAYMKPKLAADSKLELRPVMSTVTSKNWKDSKGKIVAALGKVKLAADADINDIREVLDLLDENTEEVAEVVADPEAAPAPVEEDVKPAVDEDGDVVDRVTEFLQGKLSDEDLQNVLTLMKPEVDAPPSDPSADPANDVTGPVKLPGAKDAEKKDDKEPMITKSAMDAALRVTAAETEKRTIARLRSIAEAERIVRPFVGEIVAMDSAEAVFKLALDAAKIDLTGVPKEAFGAMVRMLPKPGSEPTTRTARVAMDSAAASDYDKRYQASRLKHR